MTRYTLNVRWSVRRESLEECAERLWQFMRGIRECHDLFSQWYEMGESLEDALSRKVDVLSRQELLNLLARGRNRRDSDGGIIEELGHSVGIWNGHEGTKGCNVLAACCRYGERVGNGVSLDLPEELGGFADPAMASRLLTIAARAWDPDRGGVVSLEELRAASFVRYTDEAGREVSRMRKLPGPFVDWMVYVSRRLKRIASVPSPSTLIPVDDMGVVIVVEPHPPSRDNSEDMKNIRAIEEIVSDL